MVYSARSDSLGLEPSKAVGLSAFPGSYHETSSHELRNTCLSVLCKLVRNSKVALVIADQPNFLHLKQTITFIGTIISLQRALALQVGCSRNSRICLIR